MAEMKRLYAIQERGQVTLPREWREQFGLKKGDLVSFSIDKQGRLIVSARSAIETEALEHLRSVLKKKGISVEDMARAVEEDNQETSNQELTQEERVRRAREFYELVRPFGEEVARRGITEEELMAELEKDKAAVYEKYYGDTNKKKKA
jgi:AbrB family looped-hinge helix DNA binding protein